MGWRSRLLCMLTAGLVWLGGSAELRAQGMNMGSPNLPNMGSLSLAPGQLMGSGGPAKPPDPIIYVTDSYVGFIEGAVPRNLFTIRFEGGYNNTQPTRAEYFHPKGGLPNSGGFPLIETKIDYLDFTTYAEYALTPWFSTFIEAPYRWLNPEVNPNQSGASDLKYGFKLCTWSSDSVIATILMRVYQPTARLATLGTDHWSIEPGLLGAYRFNPSILIEGECRYFMPINGSDFAGDVLRYGAGVSYGQRNPSGVWYMPVLETIGWTVLNGKSIVASTPDNYIIQDQHGQTIINAYLGLRWGYGSNLDFYAGYGRAFTSEAWSRDLFRVEMRFTY